MASRRILFTTIAHFETLPVFDYEWGNDVIEQMELEQMAIEHTEIEQIS